MSDETTETTPETAPDVQKEENPAIPPEVSKDIHDFIESTVKMTKAELLAKAAELGKDYQEDQVNEGWLRRNVQRMYQKLALSKAGIVTVPRIKRNDAEHEASGEKTAPEKKGVGRTRMTKEGNYKLVLGQDGNTGRPGSTKNLILEAIKGKESFTYEEFRAAVVAAMKYDEGTKAFGVDTRFETIELASGAWWSELKNKAKIIVQV